MRLTKENLDMLRIRKNAGDIASMYFQDLMDTIDALEQEKVAQVELTSNLVADANFKIKQLESEKVASVAAALDEIDKIAEADMLSGNPITGAHHRAIEKYRTLNSDSSAALDRVVAAAVLAESEWWHPLFHKIGASCVGCLHVAANRAAAKDQNR